MAGSRTLKLSILADVDDLNKKLKQADQDVGGFTGQLEKFGKMAAAAFAAAAAAAAAYAGKLAVDGVKAAIEDEAAQKRLAQALEAATGATVKQIQATETYISKMQLATGVSDTELRSAMGRLALSTNDVTKAQELLSLALDISKARGIPLEAVANALGKAFDGQTTALARLGLGLSSAELKGKSFNDIQDQLNKNFGGAAAAAAETYQGRIDRLKQAFAEFQENVGYKIIPILEDFINLIVNNVIPNIGKFISIFKPVADAIERNKESFQKFGEIIEKYILPLLGVAFVGALKVVASVAAGVIDVIAKVASGITTVVNGAIAGINMLIKAYNAIPVLPNIPTIGTISAPKISVPSVSGNIPSTTIKVPTTPTISTPSSGTTSGTTTASTATSNAGTALSGVTFGSVGAKPFSQPMTIAGQTPSVTVNIGVAGDPEGTARTIIDVLNRSYGRGALGAESLTL
jgi:prefoldin subunit 5